MHIPHKTLLGCKQTTYQEPVVPTIDTTNHSRTTLLARLYESCSKKYQAASARILSELPVKHTVVKKDCTVSQLYSAQPV